MGKRKTALQRYCERVTGGKIAACSKLRKTCARLLNEMEHGCGKWHFDAKAAERPVEFIERFCRIPSGKLGAPFVLEDYEKAWVESLFGFVDDEGNRRFREGFIMVARKQGKTSCLAALELYMLTSDGEGSPQIYNAATSEQQARLGFNAACKMRAMSPEISKMVKKRHADLYCDANFGYIMPLSGNSGTMDGLDIHFAAIDEIHAMKDREVYDLLKQATAARENPMIVCITTNGFVRNSIFDAQYAYAKGWIDGTVADDRFLPWIYELDDKDEWDDPKCWVKANPGLGTVKKREYMREQVAKAKSDPSYKATVMTKDFNMPENSAQAWLDFDEAVNEAVYLSEGTDFRGLGFRYCVVGFDASETVDLTSAQALMMRPGDDRIYVKSMYWIPEDVILSLDESGRKERDNAPYRQWIARGLMRTVPGNKIDKRVLIEWLVELRDELDVYTYALGYDPWHMTEDYLLSELKSFVGESRVMPVRQGAQTLSQPMKQLRADYRSNRVVDNHNPINEWCRMNVMVRSDVNGNIQPVKKGLDPRNRIDGFMAELDAYVVLNRLMEGYQQVC